MCMYSASFYNLKNHDACKQHLKEYHMDLDNGSVFDHETYNSNLTRDLTCTISISLLKFAVMKNKGIFIPR